MTCNTSAGQNILLAANPSLASIDATNYDAFPLSRLQSNGPDVNVTDLQGYWFSVMIGVLLQFIAPPGDTSILLPSVMQSNLTSLRIEFFGRIQDKEKEAHNR